MSRRPVPELDAARLRLRAEQAAASLAPPADADSDTLKRWHELQVSQIELEMQNTALHELEQERDQAEAGRDHYAQLYDQAPAAYFSVGGDGRISRANLAAAALLDCRREDLLGRTFEQFVAPQAQPQWRRFLAALFAGGGREVLELPLFEPDQQGQGDTVRQIRVEANLDQLGLNCRMIVTDIGGASLRDAARKRALQVLDSIDEGVLVTDAGKRIVTVNPAFTRLTGYLAEEVLGRDPAFLGQRGAHPSGFHVQALHQLQTHGSWQGEVHNRMRDGTPFLASMSLTALRGDDGEIIHYVGVFSDITARKQAETALQELTRELDARVVARTAELTATNALLLREVAERKRAEAELHQSREQLRKLADHLETVKENERKRIAQEIHDELGQNLLALRIDISMLSTRTGERHPRLHQRIGDVLGNVDSTIKSVRGIMNELRPPVLDLGLQAAIEWQVAEFRKRTGLACILALPDETIFGAIGAEIEIVLFRSLQEALTNVMRHAGASHVEVRLKATRRRLTLTVADNGVGIAPQHRDKSDSFGLVGIAERIAAQGGSFDIAQFVPGLGCVLTMSFALAPALPA